MDNVDAVKDLNKHFPDLEKDLIYVDDPRFFEFPNQIKLYKGDTLVIEVLYSKLYINNTYFYKFIFITGRKLECSK